MGILTRRAFIGSSLLCVFQKQVSGIQMQPLVVANEFFQLKEEDYELVIAKYGVEDKMVRDSIANIRDWYKMQLHLPEGAFPDEQIFRLLLGTGFSLEKTKRKIDNLLTARNLMPEIMINRDPCSDRLKNAREYIDVTVIPLRLDDFTRIAVVTHKGDDFSKLDVNESVKFSFMVHEYVTISDLCLGEHYIIDWKGVKLDLISRLTPALIKKSLFLLHECYGAKIKSIHYTNVPTYAEIMVKLLKVACSEKIGNRLHLHSGYEGLYNFFPKSHLPSDFGGENKSMQTLSDELVEQMVKRRDWFLEQDQYRTDESKRVDAGAAMSKELQGIQGTFRTINID